MAFAVMAALHSLFVLAGALLMLASLPLVFELALLSSAAALPARRVGSTQDDNFPLAVVIPAHNERELIATCVQTIQESDRLVNVYVVAHNCSDETAQLAERAGARVLVLNDDGRGGKGSALEHGFSIAREEGAKAVMVVDADSVVGRNLVAKTRAAFRAGADATQCRYVVANSSATPRTRLLALAFLGINVVRPCGRHRLGLSCGIFGNGFALSADTLQQVPYIAHSVVEDLEYHLMLVKAGRRVLFLDGAEVRGEMPDNSGAATTQRARWEGGRSRIRRNLAASLFLEALQGKLRLWEPLLDLLALPIATGVLLLCCCLLLPVGWVRIYGIAGLLIIAFHILVCVRVSDDPRGTTRAIAAVPSHFLFKGRLLARKRSASQSGAEWVRTERNKKQL